MIQPIEETADVFAQGPPESGARPLRIVWMLCALVCLLCLNGCVTPASTQASAEALTERLKGLNPGIAADEAKTTAETAYFYSLELAKRYRVVRPAIFHNVLVNLGVRKRGLCFQWADDLTDKLQTLGLRTIQLHRGVARLNTRREHSSVVLTAPGQRFEDGVVLDAWRHSGHLFWGDVKKDHYPWIEVDLVAEDGASSQGQTHSSQ